MAKPTAAVAASPKPAQGDLEAISEEPISDEAIVSRVLTGEKNLFGLLLRRYDQRLYRVARAVLRDDAEAEDVVQEAWVRAFQHLHQYAGRACFSTWLTRIAMYEAWARARRRKKLVPIAPGPDAEAHPMNESISGASDPEREAAEREATSALEAAIEALPESYRSVFVLRGLEGLSTAEAAECLDLTPEAVKTRLHRARNLLRKELSRVASPLTGVFPFLGARCDGMVARVLARIGASARP
jgi:RNA polymerase sigma-70 factor (ECF subfamily)